MNAPHRKRHGVVYTPEFIVGLILGHTLPSNPDELAQAAVCDPACGDGAFLTAAARRMLDALPREAALSALRRLTGYDIDGAALARCRQQLDGLLAAYYPDERIDWNIIRRNALDRPAFRADGGRFTHIIGNPPYVRVQHLERDGRQRLAGQWSVLRGATDLYLIFFELGLDLLRPGGMLGYITPSSWLRSDSGAPLRRYLTESHQVKKLIDFAEHQIFSEVTTYTAITFIEKSGEKSGPSAFIPAEKYDGRRLHPGGQIALDPADPARPWVASTDAERRRLAALARRGPKLGEIADIHVGIQTLADAVFILPEAGLPEAVAPGESRPGYSAVSLRGETAWLESRMLREIVKASVIQGGQDRQRRLLIYPYDADGKLLPEEELAESAPAVYRWLLANQARLLQRDKGQCDPQRWYAFGRPVSILSGFGDKILTSGMNRRPNFQRCPNPGGHFLLRLLHQAPRRHRRRRPAANPEFRGYGVLHPPDQPPLSRRLALLRQILHPKLPCLGGPVLNAGPGQSIELNKISSGCLAANLPVALSSLAKPVGLLPRPHPDRAAGV